MAAETKIIANMAAPSTSPGIWERITLQMTASLHLEEVLTTITQGLVDDLGAAFARIWLLGPGDLCATCFKATVCPNRTRCLHLRASAGVYTNVNGEFRRVPLDGLKIGQIAQGLKALATNDVMGDDRVPNKAWLRQNGLRAFAGYPLTFRGELLGVIALFSRRTLTQQEVDHLPIFAHQAAIAIKNAQLFGEVDRLRQQLQAENVYLQEEIRLQHNFDEIISHSDAMQRVLCQVEQVAPSDATVLILGETGTGKELLARAVHNLSSRNHRSLVKVNCAALPSSLIESELFGHEKGAFTGAISRRIGRFELAHQGTIFLDEIGDLPLDLQAKLLRVLQEGEFEPVGSSKTINVDIRVVAATHRNLEQMVKDGTFRSDLLYRLNVFPLHVPPLRERDEDIILLAEAFAQNLARRSGRAVARLSEVDKSTLKHYGWPGNIRELHNVIECAFITSKDGQTLNLTRALPEALPPAPVERERIDTPSPCQESILTDREMRQLERENLIRALTQTDWKISGPGGAAEHLGLHPNTLSSRMKTLGIERPQRS